MTERPDHPRSDAIENNERLGLRTSDAVEENKRSVLPTSGTSIDNNSPTAHLAIPSVEEFRRRTGADELRDVLKAETGYSSYGDYLEAYKAERPYLEPLLKSLIPVGHVIACRESRFTILDLLNSGNSKPRVVPRCDSISATSTVRALRQPPADVDVQILLWNTSDYLKCDEVNALGLDLKIDPRFFLHFCDVGRRHMDPKYVRIAHSVATVVRHYNPDKLDAVPIVLIAGSEWDSEVANAVEEEIGGIFPFQYPAVETFPFYMPSSDRGLFWDFDAPAKSHHQNYALLLNWYLENEEEPAVGVTGLILKPMIPLLYLGIFMVRNVCESIRSDYNQLQGGLTCFETEREKLISDLPKNRLRLRGMVENSEDGFDHFLQLQVGELALQESKKSIELSNRQIEEGKRVKICKRENWVYSKVEDTDMTSVTILAFIYVPLNLATSIFGMNLSELNGSGKNLRVFLTTAIIALLITGASWFLIEEVNNGLRWHKNHDTKRQQSGIYGPRIHLTVRARIGMLALLWKYEHQKWMWRSGAWWRILINDSSQLSQQSEAGGLSACEYVSKHIENEYYSIPEQPFEPLNPDAMYEWSAGTSDRSDRSHNVISFPRLGTSSP